MERKRSTEGYSKINRKPQTHKRLRKKRVPIPVQPPKIPLGPFPEPSGMQLLYQKFKNDKNVDKNIHEEESSIDVSSPRDTNSPIVSIKKTLLGISRIILISNINIFITVWSTQ